LLSDKKYVSERFSSRPLIPEVFLNKTLELFGKKIPIVLFTPYNMRLNFVTKNSKSKRYKKFINNEYPEISSIISLPTDIYNHDPLNEIVKFHSEILIFNINNIKPHYFFKE
jgi:type I restriction enzyme M protein